MNYTEIADKHVWEEILTKMNRKDENSARRYRRYNKSLEAMGEKTVVKEASKGGCSFENNSANTSESFLQGIENDALFRSLHGLSTKQMLIILLVYEKRFSLQEVSKLINSNYDLVQKSHYRAIDKLKKKILKNF